MVLNEPSQNLPPLFTFPFIYTHTPPALLLSFTQTQIHTMGLQSQLNDVSSDSIPLLFLALIANCLCCLRNFLSNILHSTRPQPSVDDANLLGSGLASLIVLTEQLNLNKLFSYRYCCDLNRGGGGSDCVVCLCTLRDGDRVRKLDCRHVFHKDCFDGWLDHLNFNCPLCRTPLIAAADERVDSTQRRVGGDLIDWFSYR